MNKCKEMLKQSRSKIAIILLGIIFIVWMVILFIHRTKEMSVLRQQTTADAVTRVALIKAQPSAVKEKITLPGTVMAWHEAPIYARTQGYIKDWYVDIGSKVKKDALLAQIETPELNEQLRQAEADLKMAIAQNKLAQSTAARWLNLRKSDSVSQQATDEKVDNATALTAAMNSKIANRDRLRQLVEFERVIAPFDGVISDRRTDLGALINVGAKPNEQQPLFRIVQINPLRLYVKIPQGYSSRIQTNADVQLEFAEHPGKAFSARLLETAHAIDPTTRTLLAQFMVKNAEGILLPGAYTTVYFSIPAHPGSVQLPINTLIFRKDGLQVATLDKNNQVVLKNVTIDKDLGNYVEIASGINLGESVVINPSDSIFAGQQIQIVPSRITT